ncbi:MAG: hypothetical protein SFY68_10360 [Candidatus Sumerlaeia bacterium]|nr:hypothetical protein [Candidatus Sumerlaeia bacterium]
MFLCRSFLSISCVLALFQGVNAAEFCTPPTPEVAGEYACHGALSEGTGGLLVFERAVSGKPLFIVGQWVDGQFAADGPEFVISAHETGPCWRPSAVLISDDEAFVVWADGENQIQPPHYVGFGLKGSYIRRGEQPLTRTFDLISRNTVPSLDWIIEPSIAHSPLAKRIVIGGWAIENGLGGFGHNSFSTQINWETDSPTLKGFQLQPSLALGAISFQLSEPYVVGSSGNILTEFTLRPGGEKTIFDFSDLSGEGTWDYPSVSYGPQGSTSLGVTLAYPDASNPDGFRVKGYALRAYNAAGEITHEGVYTGALPAVNNICRPTVAYSGSNPVAFLPIVAVDGTVQLLVAPIPAVGTDSRMSEQSGSLYPLPGALNQFRVIFLDEGAYGKAALIASSGEASPRVCVWPSELIGF